MVLGGRAAVALEVHPQTPALHGTTVHGATSAQPLLAGSLPDQRRAVARAAATSAVAVSVAAVARSRRRRGSVALRAEKKANNTGRRVLSLDSSDNIGIEGDQELDLTKCYLDKLGPAEAATLAQLRQRVPQMVARARSASPAAAAMQSLDVFGVRIEEDSPASDVVLLKFLRAAGADVNKAEDRLIATLVYRAENGVGRMASEELPEHFQGHDFIGGTDACGRPIMLSRYGKMDNEKVFGDPDAFVKYRMQVMEKAIAQLSFKAGEAEDLCQIHDYTGVNLVFKSAEVKAGIAAMADVFGAHYPETKGTTIFVNFPPLFSKLFQVFANFIPKKTRDKFTILGTGDQHLLFEKIPPENVLEEHGGMKRQAVASSTLASAACSQVSVGAGGEQEVELLKVADAGALDWELRVSAGEVLHELVFAPSSGGPEQVLSQSTAKDPLQSTRGVIAGAFTAPQAGSLLCRFSNDASWFQSRLCLCRAAPAA